MISIHINCSNFSYAERFLSVAYFNSLTTKSLFTLIMVQEWKQMITKSAIFSVCVWILHTTILGLNNCLNTNAADSLFLSESKNHYLLLCCVFHYGLCSWHDLSVLMLECGFLKHVISITMCENPVLCPIRFTTVYLARVLQILVRGKPRYSHTSI